MKNYVAQIAAAIVFGILFLIVVVKIRSAQSSPDTPQKDRVVLVENKYTAEQKALLSEMNQMRAEIVMAKREINDTLTSIRAAAVQRGMNPNVRTDWLVNGYYGPTNISAIYSNGKPILWGIRADGLVTWRTQ